MSSISPLVMIESRVGCNSLRSLRFAPSIRIRGPVTVRELARVHDVVTQRGQPTSKPNR